MSKKKNKQKKQPAEKLAKKVEKIFTSHTGKEYTFNQVHKKLVVKASREELAAALEYLVYDGKVMVTDHGRFSLATQKSKIPSSKTISGVVDLTAQGNAYVISKELESDVFIPSRALNRAFDGDRVKVALRANRRGKPEGEILEVIGRSRHDVVGQVELHKDFAFVVPDKRKIPVDIYVPKEHVGEAQQDDRVIVRIMDWPEDHKNPIGKVIERLSGLGPNDEEMKTILVDNGFPLEFSDKVHEEVANMDMEITEEEIKKRKDFRNVTTFTIDPEDAKDFDDALSLRKLENGNFEVGVHIADVSHYLKPGTQLDKEAYTRATSVYLVDRVLPMLPEELSNIVCSLRPDEDKLCFAAVFEIDPKANIKSRWFGRTVIRSDRRFTYDEVQQVIDGENGDFDKEIRILNDLATKLRSEKFKNGAIAFETVEVKFKIDLEGVPVGVLVKERNESHMLIEDFMLLANKEVAAFASQKKKEIKNLQFVYRVHDTPDFEKLLNFTKMAQSFGYTMNIDTPDQISRSLNKLMEEVKGKPEQDMLEQLAIRSMAKAIYTVNNIGHYGLAFDNYTHFTSPIRRYPDVLVHRLLNMLLTKSYKPVEKLEDQCVHCSWMERKAMDAERESVKFKQAEYMQSRVGQEFDGLVTGVTTFGIFVEIIENKCEGLVDIDTLDDDYYMFHEREKSLVGKTTGNRYRLGDEVRIKVIKSDPKKRRIDYELD